MRHSLHSVLFSERSKTRDKAGVVVKLADSKDRGCELGSCTCHNKNTIGEEGNGEPIH